MYDLRVSLRNPFSSAKINRRKYVAFVAVTVVGLCWAMYASNNMAMSLYGFCWIPAYGGSGVINHDAFAFGYIPFFLLYAFDIVTLLLSRRRLRHGLRKTYKVRSQVFRDTLFVVGGYAWLYLIVWILMGTSFFRAGIFCSFLQEWVPALVAVAVFTSRGAVTLGMWLARNWKAMGYHRCCESSAARSERVRSRTMSNSVSFLAAASTTGAVDEPHLNLALRTEVIAYTRAALQMCLHAVARTPFRSVELAREDSHGTGLLAPLIYGGDVAEADVGTVEMRDDDRDGSRLDRERGMSSSLRELNDVGVEDLSDAWFDVIVDEAKARSHVVELVEREVERSDPLAAHADIQPSRSVATVETDPPPMEIKHLAPHIFYKIRQSIGIDEAEFGSSLMSTVNERSSEGASKMLFCETEDNRYVIKTIKSSDAKRLQRIVREYCVFLQNNPDTLLVKILACISLKLYEQRLYVMVMENVLNTEREVHQKFDLKGSWVNRTAKRVPDGRLAECRFCYEQYVVGDSSPCLARPNGAHEPNVLFLDNDLTFKLRLAPETAHTLAQQLTSDSTFLEELGIMDYSLLVGVNRTHFELSLTAQGRAAVSGAGDRRSGARRTMRRRPRGPARSASSQGLTSVLRHEGSSGGDWVAPEWAPPRGREFVPFHRKQFGGVLPRVVEGPGVYYLGVVDILQGWDISKRAERMGRLISCQDSRGMSCINPTQYRDRFVARVVNALIEVGGADEYEVKTPDPLLSVVASGSVARSVTSAGRGAAVGTPSSISSSRGGFDDEEARSDALTAESLTAIGEDSKPAR